MSRWRLPEFGRFLSVGVLNLLFGLLVIYCAKWFLEWGDVAANALGYSAGLALSFTLNSRWTFGYRGARAPAAVKFVLVALLVVALIGAAMAPGATALTRIPWGASSLAIDSTNSFCPPFDAL